MVNDPKGHVCPECGAPRGADNTPSCECTERAADAHHETRTAEAAAAEDFDPLRIRPYVELTPATPAATDPPQHPDPASDATMPMPAVPETTPGWPEEAPTTAIPAHRPLDHLTEDDEQPARSGSRPRVLLLGAAGAVVAVLAAGGLAGGMFTYDKPSRNDTAAQDVRESVPAATTSAAASPTPSSSPTSLKPAPPPPPPSRSASVPTPSPTPTSASPTPSRSATPSQAPTTAQATGTVSPAPGDDDKDTPPVLRSGDRGDEVLELQLRLRELAVYLNDTDGVYDDNVENAVTNYQTTRGIETEEPGVYDRTTRERLESETTDP